MTKPPSNVLIVGSIAFDVIFSIAHDFRDAIPVEKGHIRNFNASFVADEKKEFPGGTAGNIAFWMGTGTRQCSVPTVFSAWGKDFESKGYRKKLEDLGTIFRGPQGQFTAHAYMVSDPLHQQLIIWQPNSYTKIEQEGILHHFSPEELKQFKYAIFSAGTPSSIHQHMTEFREHNPDATILFDPGQVTPIFPQQEFEQCCHFANILIGNDIEFEHFRKFEIPQNMITIETLGERGVIVSNRNKNTQQHFPALNVPNVVETTGAGDAFRAGILTGLAQGRSLEDSIHLGIELGAQCVTLPSAQYDQKPER